MIQNERSHIQFLLSWSLNLNWIIFSQCCNFDQILFLIAFIWWCLWLTLLWYFIIIKTTQCFMTCTIHRTTLYYIMKLQSIVSESLIIYILRARLYPKDLECNMFIASNVRQRQSLICLFMKKPISFVDIVFGNIDANHLAIIF